MTRPFEVVDDDYQGDPFVKLVRCGGKLYRVDESALIEDFHNADRSFEMRMRMDSEDAMERLRRMGW